MRAALVTPAAALPWPTVAAEPVRWGWVVPTRADSGRPVFGPLFGSREFSEQSEPVYSEVLGAGYDGCEISVDADEVERGVLLGFELKLAHHVETAAEASSGDDGYVALPVHSCRAVPVASGSPAPEDPYICHVDRLRYLSSSEIILDAGVAGFGGMRPGPSVFSGLVDIDAARACPRREV